MNKDKTSNSVSGIADKLYQTYSKHSSKIMPKNKIATDNGDTIEVEIVDKSDKHKKVSIIEKNTELEQMQKNNSELVKQIEELSQKNEELSNNNAEIEDMLKRKVAEFENYKRRTDKEKVELLDYGSSRLFSKLVDLLDDLKNADDAAKKAADISSVITGLEMIRQKTEKLFADEGVAPLEVNIGDEFNVEMHEALMAQPSDLPEGQITMVLQSGYKYKDKIIRYAKVATSAGN